MSARLAPVPVAGSVRVPVRVDGDDDGSLGGNSVANVRRFFTWFFTSDGFLLRMSTDTGEGDAAGEDSVDDATDV